MGTGIEFQILMTIASIGYQQAQHAKMKRKMDAAAEARKGQKFTVQGESAPLPVVYGKQRLGGIHCNYLVKSSYPAVSSENADKAFGKNFGNNTLNSISGGISGSKNEFLGVQTALCHGGIEGVQHILVNEIDYRGLDQEMKEDETEYSHRFLIHNDGGTSDTSANAFGFLDTNRFTGAAYVNNFFKLDRDNPQYQGVPNIGYIVKGRKVKLVIRNGSGTEQDPYTYSLTSGNYYSNNPALCLLDYLLNSDFGRGLTVDEVDLESFFNAAQICDTPVVDGNGNSIDFTIGGQVNGVKPIFAYPSLSDFPDDDNGDTIEPYMADYLYYAEDTDTLYTHTQSGAGTEENPYTVTYAVTTAPATENKTIYECNITLSTEETIRNNIERILSTMGLANLVWTPKGQYKLILSYPTTQTEQNALVVATFDDDTIIRDDINLSFTKAQDKFNQVTVTFDNEFEEFKEDTITWPPTNSVAHQEYLSEDNNQPLTNSIRANGVTNRYHAQALAEQTVRSSRSLYTIEFTADKTGLFIEPGDLIKVNLDSMGINNEVFQVESIKVNSDFSVKISGFRFDFRTLAWNVPNDTAYSVRATKDFKVTAPSSLTFTPYSETLDGSNIVPNNNFLGIASGTLNWIAANDISVKDYVVEISNDYNLFANPPINEEDATFLKLGTTSGTTFDVTGLQTGVYTFAVRSRTITGQLSKRVIVDQNTIQLKAAGKIAVIYASSADETTNTQSYDVNDSAFTDPEPEFIAYYEYFTDTRPTLPIRSSIDFVKFIGADGAAGPAGPAGEAAWPVMGKTVNNFLVRTNPVGDLSAFPYSIQFNDDSLGTPYNGDQAFELLDVSNNPTGDIEEVRKIRLGYNPNNSDRIDDYDRVQIGDSITLFGTTSFYSSSLGSILDTTVDYTSGTNLDLISNTINFSPASGLIKIKMTKNGNPITDYSQNFIINVSGMLYSGGSSSTTNSLKDNKYYVSDFMLGGVSYNNFDGIVDGYWVITDERWASINTIRITGGDSLTGIDISIEQSVYWGSPIKAAYEITAANRVTDYLELSVSPIKTERNYNFITIPGLHLSANRRLSKGLIDINFAFSFVTEGIEGTRGPGWWRYEDTTNTASIYYLNNVVQQAAIESLFSTIIGLNSVVGDRFIIKATDDTIAFIKEDDTQGNEVWAYQSEFLDGNLLVAGTITADKLVATDLQTLGLTIGTLSNSPTGERLVLSDDKIEVFDASNVLRVKIGDLT